MYKNSSDQFLSSTISNSKYFLLLFLVWPFLAFIAALTNYDQKNSRRVVYIFIIYYGLTFVLGDIGADAEEYVRRLKNFAELPTSAFFEIFGTLYSSDTTVDIVQPLISFIVSRFTSHHSVLFGVYAALFGFFYLKSINLLYDQYSENSSWNTMIFMAFFIVILPVTAINGFRMWTASWIFFYGAYHVILNRDPKYFLISLGAALVHFSFLSANAILIIYYFAGNRNIIYLPIAIASFILPQLIAPVFQLISLRLGGSLQSRYEMYSNEEYVLGRQESFEQSVWFVKLSDSLILNYFLLAIILIYFSYGYLMKEKKESNLLSFMLLFLSFVNFGKAIPSFGGRFQTIFLMFATLYLFLFFLKFSGNKINFLTWLGLFPMALYAALQFRNGSDSINTWLFTPGFGLPLLVPGISISDFLFS